VKKIKEDEIARLEFGIKWLESLFFKDESKDSFEMNENAAVARKTS